MSKGAADMRPGMGVISSSGSKEAKGAADMRPKEYFIKDMPFGGSITIPVSTAEQVKVAKQHNAGVELANLVPDIKKYIQGLCNPTTNVVSFDLTGDLVMERDRVVRLLKTLGYKVTFFPVNMNKVLVEVSV